MVARFHVPILIFILILAWPPLAIALTAYRSADGVLSARLTGYVKTLAVGLDASLPGVSDTAEDFTRGRLMFEGNVGTRVSWTVHYEHFGVINPAGDATTGFFAGDRSIGTQRLSLLPLDWTVKEAGSFLWRHELDRLN